MSRVVVKLLNATLALFFGSGLTCVYALTGTDFTNTGTVLSAPTQFENNATNNDSAVQVLPKGLTVTKLADASGLSTPTQAGDVINYRITLDNIGLLGLTGITLVDTIIPAAGISLLSGDTNNDAVLDADETWVFTGAYSVTQSDIDSFGGGDGNIDNVVTVSSNELAAISDSAAVAITQAPAYSITKSVDQTEIGSPGALDYTITLSNTGNQSLTGVVISDTLPDGSNASLSGPINDTGVSGALDVAESWVFTGSYTATQTDIDAGTALVNAVTASTVQTGTQSQTALAQTTIASAPAMLVAKTVDVAQINAPSTLNYNITLSNTGNVSLTNIQASDTLPDASVGVLVGPAGDAGIANVLEVGETWTYTASYNATQVDIDKGVPLTNQVSFTSDETGTAAVSDNASTTIVSEPAMSVAKSVDLSSLSAPGNLSYQILVNNTGNVSLSNIVLVDTLPDGTTATLVGPVTDTGIAGQLGVGEQWEFTTSYAVSQAEIDFGQVRTNMVDVSSTETGATNYQDVAVTTLTQSPSFSVTKTVDATSISAPTALNYSIVVSNTGNTSLTNLVVSDQMPDGSVGVVTGPLADAGASGVLDVGEVWNYTAQYTATQADIDGGGALTNSASVATTEAGTLSNTAITNIAQAPGITISKASSEPTFTAAGNSVNFTLTVTNNGNVVLDNIVVNDPIANPGSLSCELGMPFTLVPNQQTSCSLIHTVTSAELGATQVSNQASVSGKDPAGSELSALSNTVVIPLLAVAPVAQENEWISQVSGVAVSMLGAQDDTDINGDLDVSSVNLTASAATDTDGDGDNDSLVVAGEGTWLVDNATGSITFTPLPGFTADPTPTAYVISDATGLVSNAVSLVIDYPQSAPVAKDDYKENTGVESPTNNTSIAVLEDNGNGVDSDAENDIVVQSVSLVDALATDTDGDGDNDLLIVDGQGQWSVENDTGIVTFTPAAGFLADPSPILYTVSDVNALVSNTASITVDYPQTAPVAQNDENLGQPLGQAITVAILANDTDAENNLDASTVMLVSPVSGERVTQYEVPEQGLWRIDPVNGDATFKPVAGFITDPSPIQYTVSDTTGLESNLATITVGYEAPAALEGIVWLDSNSNGVVDAAEERKPGWTLRVKNTNGELVATALTDADGYYLIEGLIPGAFTIEFFNQNGVFMDSQTTDGVVLSGQTVNLPLPVDPGGIVYDSITRLPVSGVTLNMVDANGSLLHADCLQANQQSQVTLEDGLYAFNLLPGSHSTCPSESLYRIQVANAPSDYYPNFSTVLRQEGAQQCGDATLGCAVSATFDADTEEVNCTIDAIPGTRACEVQQQPDAPIDSESTLYFVEFYIQSGDRNVVFNHLPIDSRANDAQLLLSKTSNKRKVSVGSLLEYTLVAENTKEVPAVDIAIVDVPPANFTLVDSSAKLIQAGSDGEFDTDDDVVSALAMSDSSPIVFSNIDFAALETIRIQYLMRVGAGVVVGAYANKASATGPGGVASNTVSATVNVIPDPVLEQATLVGKVFNDRDSDGAQDSADATGLALGSEHYGWNGLRLPPMPGRSSVNDDPASHAITVNMPFSQDNRFMLVTREGTRISVDQQGTITEAHVGDKARGLNAQDIRVCTQEVQAPPTDKSANTAENASHERVLQIVIQNYGVNEEGIPGVRLATVTGLLIETDAYGRYSIPDVNAGAIGIGQNFVLKVDPASLPQGSRFTTENPYVLRIVSSALNKINFGVQVPDTDPYLGAPTELCNTQSVERANSQVEVLLGSVFFESNEPGVRDDQRGIVLDIVNKLREYGGGQILIQAHTDGHGPSDYNIALAQRRAEAIRKILSESLGEERMKLISVDVDPAAYAETEK